MAFQNVGSTFITKNGVDYNLQYDAPLGKVQIIQANAPAGTLPIYQDGRWTAIASETGLTSSDFQSYHTSVQNQIQSAYKILGPEKAILPQWANTGQQAGQTSIIPSQNTTTADTGSGNGLTNAIGGISNLAFTIGNLEQAVTNYAVNGDKFGVGNESSLFGTTMVYPVDMNTEQQDNLQITQFRYKPSKAGDLFGGDKAAVNILTNGLQAGSNLSEKIGLVMLPMPNKVADSNNVSWGEDAMNNLAAAATAATLTPGGLASSAIAGGLSKVLGGSFGTGVVTANLLRLLGSGGLSPELSLLLGPSFASKILKAGGFGVEAESILARGAGIIPNSNLELLFNAPTLRTFTFSYRLSPRDEKEAQTVRRILRFFKQGMAAKKTTGKAGQSSFFLGTPNVFKLEYKIGGENRGQLIDGVNRFKTCALSSFQCDYTPDGFWAAYSQGQPISTVMSMTFNELEPIYDTDYQSGVLSDRNDLNSVNDQSVGY